MHLHNLIRMYVSEKWPRSKLHDNAFSFANNPIRIWKSEHRTCNVVILKRNSGSGIVLFFRIAYVRTCNRFSRFTLRTGKFNFWNSAAEKNQTYLFDNFAYWYLLEFIQDKIMCHSNVIYEKWKDRFCTVRTFWNVLSKI